MAYPTPVPTPYPYSSPIGPSKPGYIQGTANTQTLIPASGPGPQYANNTLSSPTRLVLGANTSAFTGGGGYAPAAPVSPVNSLFTGANAAATSQNNALLSQLNTQYDQTAADLNNQLSSLGTQKANSLSSLDTQLAGVQKQVNTSKQDSQDSTSKNVQDALSTAQEVERTNRNKLRALGILNSSAAGDLLSKPLTEYDKQRATILDANTKRLSQLDDFMNQKTAEHSDAVRSIESQYTDLVGKIQTDLRFNDRQRADAIQSANAALQQRLQDIQTQQLNYQMQVDAMKQNIAQQSQQLMAYQAPTYDANAINSTGFTINPTNQGASPNIVQEDPRKRILAGLGFTA